MKFFAGNRSTRADVEELIQDNLRASGRSVSAAAVTSILEDCRLTAARAPLGTDFGDSLLRRYSAGEIKVVALVQKWRCDGVTDSDIRAWYNRSDLHRAVIDYFNDEARLTLFVKAMTDLDDATAAGTAVRKIHVMYGDSEDESVTKGDDAPLPEALFDRVEGFIKSYYSRPEEFLRDTDRASTFNALVREKVRAGLV